MSVWDLPPADLAAAAIWEVIADHPVGHFSADDLVGVAAVHAGVSLELTRGEYNDLIPIADDALFMDAEAAGLTLAIIGDN